MFKKSITVNFWGSEIDERLFPRSGFKKNEQRQSLLQALTMIIVQVNTKFKTPHINKLAYTKCRFPLSPITSIYGIRTLPYL